MDLSFKEYMLRLVLLSGGIITIHYGSLAGGTVGSLSVVLGGFMIGTFIMRTA